MQQKQHISISPSKLEEAAAWHERVNNEDATAADSHALTIWLEADEQNVAAFHHVEDIAADIEDFSDELALLLEDDAQDTQESENVVRPAASFWQKQRPHVARWALGAIAASLAFLLLPPGTINVFTPEPQTQGYEALATQTRHIELADGSKVDLNRNSRLEVKMTPTGRHATLIEGEALFTVSKNPNRPFFVAVGDTQVQVVGTVFNIVRHAGEITITVSEGTVDVSPLPNTTPSNTKTASYAERLTAGKQLQHIEGRDTVTVQDVDTNNVGSWRSGQLVYKNAPLSRVAKDLKRYFNLEVQIHEGAEHLNFSGVLNTNDRAAIFTLLELSLPIKVSRLNQLIVIRARQE